jgi:hypothetical protein
MISTFRKKLWTKLRLALLASLVLPMLSCTSLRALKSACRATADVDVAAIELPQEMRSVKMRNLEQMLANGDIPVTVGATCEF